MAARTPLDSDLWWHLAAGEQTLQHGRPLLIDTFSYTRAGEVWINHSWLGQVVLALVHRAGGWYGVCALVAALAALSFVLVFRQMKGPPIYRAFVIVLAALVAAPVWSPRPQLFSLVMLALVSGIALRYREQGRAPLFWLPLLFVLWSNLHGGYPLGLLLLGCVLAGALLDRLLGREDALTGRAMGRLALWSLACAPAVLLNPNGLDMWRIPFQTIGVELLQQAIPEWASPDFHALFQQPFMVMLAGLLFVIGLAGRPTRGEDLFKVGLFAAMGLVARRNFGPFALVCAPVLAEHGWVVIERIWQRWSGLRVSPAAGKPLPLGVQRVVNLLIVLTLGLACVIKVYSVSQPEVLEGYLAERYPQGAVAWLHANRPEGRVFNEYAWGGYLTWALPEYPVFVDGRTDLFGDEIIGEWLQVVTTQGDWQNVLERWEVGLVLARPDVHLETRLVESGWRRLYADDVSVLFGR